MASRYAAGNGTALLIISLTTALCHLVPALPIAPAVVYFWPAVTAAESIGGLHSLAATAITGQSSRNSQIAAPARHEFLGAESAHKGLERSNVVSFRVGDRRI